MNLKINSEIGQLRSVIVGTANDGNKEIHHNNPKITDSLKKGVYPEEPELVSDTEYLARTLQEHGVEVLRPVNLAEQSQIFTRDIGFVIGDKFVVSRMAKDNRKGEIEGIQSVMDTFSSSTVINPPDGAQVEGGDVLVHPNYLFVGLGQRTNQKGVEFLQELCPDREVLGFETIQSDDPYQNILHMDCTFQPVGDGYGIIFEGGFQKHPDALYDIYGEENLIKVTAEEMYSMFPNVFSINPEKVLIEKGFERLSKELQKRNIEPVPVQYEHVSRLGGLLRCSTLPLYREA